MTKKVNVPKLKVQFAHVEPGEFTPVTVELYHFPRVGDSIDLPNYEYTCDVESVTWDFTGKPYHILVEVNS